MSTKVRVKKDMRIPWCSW